MTAVGFEPTPLRNGALSHRLRPLGQTVLVHTGATEHTDDHQETTKVAWLQPCRHACQAMRMPGVEPGAQAWEACMLPLHYMRMSTHAGHDSSPLSWAARPWLKVSTERPACCRHCCPSHEETENTSLLLALLSPQCIHLTRIELVTFSVLG